MKKLSDWELIDLTALNRILASARVVIWGIEAGYHYISDEHMAVKIRIPEKCMPTLLSGMNKCFGGELPCEGLALRCVKGRKKNDVGIISLDGIKRILGTEVLIPVVDTCIMNQRPDGNVVRALYAEDLPNRSYIFLDAWFLECINADSDVLCVKAERTSPVVFARGDEVAVVLPVNMHTPEFMVHLN